MKNTEGRRILLEGLKIAFQIDYNETDCIAVNLGQLNYYKGNMLEAENY